MDEQELAAIRQVNASSGGDDGQGAQDDGKREAEEQMRRDLLATVLDSAARERRKS
jgi:DNA-binding TFAR19-related protein (PDSD5 family)